MNRKTFVTVPVVKNYLYELMIDYFHKCVKKILFTYLLAVLPD